MMGELASAGQLRASLLRWALVTVPVILLLGLSSGRLAGFGISDGWLARLRQPSGMPPNWAFGVVWPILYVLMGLALAMMFNARRARGRGVAIGLFILQFGLNLAWPPVFFGFHQVWPALALIIALFATATAATVAMAQVRRIAAWLMVPYLAWLVAATILNAEIAHLNPYASQLAPGGASAQILD